MFSKRVEDLLFSCGYIHSETGENTKKREFDKWTKTIPVTPDLPEIALTVFIYKSMEDRTRIVSYKIEGLAKPFLTATVGSMRAKTLLFSFAPQELSVLTSLSTLYQILKAAEAEQRPARPGQYRNGPRGQGGRR